MEKSPAQVQMSNPLSDSPPMVDLHDPGEQSAAESAERADLPISVVIVSYNSRELLRACLDSIDSEQYEQVTVIDNASSDGSDAMILQEFPDVRFIKSETNNGYGGAANKAIASCSSKYVLLLNPDTLLFPGTVGALREHLDQHSRAAVVGPALRNPDGSTQPSCFAFPTPLQTLRRETSLPRILRDDLSGGSPHSARAVDWVLGAALAIRRSAFESVGGFDPSFFMYFEEVDLCYRLNKAGWQTHFTPAATVTHIGGASTKQHRAAMSLELYKSLCHFYRQHYSRGQHFQLRLVLTYIMFRNMIKTTYRRARTTDLRAADEQREDLQIWRSVLSNIWSSNGWLSP